MSGKKTYITAIAGIIFGAAGMAYGAIDPGAGLSPTEGMGFIWAGIAFFFNRLGVAKVEAAARGE